MKTKIAAVTTAVVLGMSGVAVAHNHGNGGGASGQCTGPADERPGNACQSGN